jgi:DNA-binding PadR family transcriptional regulator
MGNLYRFVEPVLLFLLKKKGRCHGYELAGDLRDYALTDTEIESAALYKTLRHLEQNGCLTSAWDVKGSGPPRRRYVLTPHGEHHLQEWATVLDHLSKSMKRLVREAQALTAERVFTPESKRTPVRLRKKTIRVARQNAGILR